MIPSVTTTRRSEIDWPTLPRRRAPVDARRPRGRVRVRRGPRSRRSRTGHRTGSRGRTPSSRRSRTPARRLRRPPAARTAGVRRICAHFFSHGAWLEGALLRDAGRLAGIPGFLVHGGSTWAARRAPRGARPRVAGRELVIVEDRVTPAATRCAPHPRPSTASPTVSARHGIPARGSRPARPRPPPRGDDRRVRGGRPGEQHDGQAQLAGGHQLRRGQLAAAVARDEHVDAVLAQQRALGVGRERAAGEQEVVAGRERRGRRVDRAQQEPGAEPRERGQVAAPGGEEHPLPQPGQQRRGRRSVRHPVPAVPRPRGPAGPAQRRAAGRPWRRVAATAFAVIRAANGWVASTTASVRCSRSHAARPSAPPKPPTRTSPWGSAGTATRPASEEVTANAGSRCSAAASRRASAVPPSTSTLRVTAAACAAGRCP